MLFTIYTLVGLGLILGIAIIILNIQKYFQDRDAKRQLEGKIPYRELKDNQNPNQEAVNTELEEERLRQDALNSGNHMMRF